MSCPIFKTGGRWWATRSYKPLSLVLLIVVIRIIFFQSPSLSLSLARALVFCQRQVHTPETWLVPSPPPLNLAFFFIMSYDLSSTKSDTISILGLPLPCLPAIFPSKMSWSMLSPCKMCPIRFSISTWFIQSWCMTSCNCLLISHVSLLLVLKLVILCYCLFNQIHLIIIFKLIFCFVGESINSCSLLLVGCHGSNPLFFSTNPPVYFTWTSTIPPQIIHDQYNAQINKFVSTSSQVPKH